MQNKHARNGNCFGQVFGCLWGHRWRKSWSEAGKCCVLCRQWVSDFGNLVRGRLKSSRKHKNISGPHIYCGTRTSSSLAARCPGVWTCPRWGSGLVPVWERRYGMRDISHLPNYSPVWAAEKIKFVQLYAELLPAAISAPSTAVVVGIVFTLQ